MNPLRQIGQMADFLGSEVSESLSPSWSSNAISNFTGIKFFRLHEMEECTGVSKRVSVWEGVDVLEHGPDMHIIQ